MSAADAMSAAEAEAHAPAVAEVERQLAALFERARVFWKEAAASFHPGLQPVAVKLLVSLARTGPLQAGLLAEQLMVDKSIISRQAKALEELGLLVSEPDPSDGRARILAPSPAALEKLAQVRAQNQELLAQRLSHWQPEEIAQFAGYLRRFSA